MNPDPRSIVEQTADLLEPVLEDMGFELVDVEYVSRNGRWVLQIYIDREGGVTIDDCVRVSHEAGSLIDVKDILDHGYVLEVSSPGLNRPLKKLKDFQWATGHTVRLRFTVPREGRSNFVGRLERVEGDLFVLTVDGEEVSFSIDEVEKANLEYEF